MPGSGEPGLVSDRIHTFHGDDDNSDGPAFQNYINNLPPWSTVYIDGIVGTDVDITLTKHIIIYGVTADSGFRLDGSAVIRVGNYVNFFASERNCQPVPALSKTIDVANADATGIAPHDWIALKSMDPISGVSPHQGGAQYPLEIHQVMAIYPGNPGRTIIELADPTYDPMVTNHKWIPLTGMIRGEISNLTLYSGPNRTPSHSIGILLSQAGNFTVGDVWVNHRTSTLPISCAGDCLIERYRMLGVPNKDQVDLVENYGIIVGTSNGVRIHDSLVNWSSHSITTTGTPPAVPGTPRYGGPLRLNVSSCTFRSRNVPALDSHAEGALITYDNCLISGFYSVSIRARESVVRNCQIHPERYGTGLIIRGSRNKIIGNKFVGGFIGIVDWSLQSAAGNLLIQGNSFDMCISCAISLSGHQTAEITGNVFSGHENYTTPVGSPLHNRSIITIRNDKPHRIYGNILRKVLNTYSIELQEAAIGAIGGLEIFDNDMTGYPNNTVGIITAVGPYPSTNQDIPEPYKSRFERLNYRTVNSVTRSPTNCLELYDEGVFVGEVCGLDFKGISVLASINPTTLLGEIFIAGSGIEVQDEGVVIGTTSKLNFVGQPVTAQISGDKINVVVSQTAAVDIFKDGNFLGIANSLNFIGPHVNLGVLAGAANVAVVGTSITAGTGIQVVGTGTQMDPFVISSSMSLVVGLTEGPGIRIQGSGTLVDPWVISVNNPASPGDNSFGC